MCTSPILIRNRKFLGLDVDTPRKYICVPCGTCPECLKRRAQDLFVRAYYEYTDCLRSGGVGFMCCLTYDNNNCPRLDINGKTYLVFNKKDVINFIKRLRINLDRFYQKHYNTDAPDFKYLITSEYGIVNHRPHYHSLFFFRQNISLFAFRSAFIKSLYNHKTGERYFGKVFQCDVIDPKKGGIKYCAKYVLKDMAFDNVQKQLRNLVNFKKDEAIQEFNLFAFPKDSKERFYNKCVRSSKKYKDFVRDNCLLYSHCMQFFLCSNDMGVSAIYNRYGENILSLPLLNVNGFSFALPKAVKIRVQEIKGDRESSVLAKNVFLSSFERAAKSLLPENKITLAQIDLLTDFIKNHVICQGGFLYFRDKHYCIYDRIFDNFEFPNYSEKYDTYSFASDNDFFTLRESVLAVISLYNSPSRLQSRLKESYEKMKLQEESYKQKKRNKGYEVF